MMPGTQQSHYPYREHEVSDPKLRRVRELSGRGQTVFQP
jgi:hypothetical protein